MRIEANGRRSFAMRRTRFIVPVVLMLLLILGQGAYWTGGAKWLAHGLEHENIGSAARLVEHHPHVLNGSDAPDSGPLSDVEHDLLHELEHAQLVPLSAISRHVLFGTAVMVALVLRCAGQRSSERIFRPPRSLS